MNVVWVFLGSGAGGVLRYLVGLSRTAGLFPWATLAVNVVGSLALGLFSGWSARFGWSNAARLLFTTGLCGGFTTFSTFTKEALALAQDGQGVLFLLYAFGSLALGLAAAWLGTCLAGRFAL